MDNTLRQALRKTRELRHQVENLLLGDDGEIWEAELKKWVTKRPCWVKPAFELYLYYKQRGAGGTGGHDIERHLDELPDIAKRAYSLEDKVVKDWLADPTTYPEELKGKNIFLWGSKRIDQFSRIEYLAWSGIRLVVLLRWIGDKWGDSDFALLKPAA
ncbi:MAG: hypothetical protein A2846_01270 [Candidatus Doudnabacteria bacterium RIFCSPHIGHO2_01_FULL_49_9]|uniref:Uncharacterized protein n=1 Tax=Candidatus Doudnabacteria bacterium RIFCSPHIGHO2_01_FULL_49_9 TaxID=1817827 RepID=A0A1F5NYY5_9BACT|nr:MAG: hypothetical protein A2846_01270 [Candidatus Doudnabacteria bacterium RIFCSPHIGHO2_01_FULL_49_9]